MTLVRKSCSLARGAERLAGTRARPDFAVVGPAGETGGVAPDSDPGEEMALSIPGKVVCSDINDAPFVHVARRDQVGRDEIAEPRGGVGVVLVVVGGHRSPDVPVRKPGVHHR